MIFSNDLTQFCRIGLVAASCTVLAACTPQLPRTPLAQHEAYVWQQSWGPAMTAAVRDRPAELKVLHVLALSYDLSGRAQPASVDAQALVGAGVVLAVVRIEGKAGLAGATLAPVTTIARAWQAKGVQVVGIEVDYDCATSQLPGYTKWLKAQKPAVAPLELAITALPTWHSSPHLRDLANAVDRVTLQVHTIAAPALFDPQAARRVCDTWGAESGKPFWLALPTYRARLATGEPLAADPKELQDFVASLKANPPPGLRGAVWFRLPYQGDPDAWPNATWQAVLRGEALRAHVQLQLRPAGESLWDIVASNTGSIAGPVPTLSNFTGKIEHLEGVRGCRAQGSQLQCPGSLQAAVGQTLVLGYVRGQEVQHAEH